MSSSLLWKKMCLQGEKRSALTIELLCINSDQHGGGRVWAIGSEKGETTNQLVKRDKRSRQGKCVRVHLSRLNIEVARAIWLVSWSAESRNWLVENYTHAHMTILEHSIVWSLTLACVCFLEGSSKHWDHTAKSTRSHTAKICRFKTLSCQRNWVAE